MRRSRRDLEGRIDAATTDAERAQAHYDLAIFHDNNSREAAAVPHYEAALALGLADAELRAHCLAYLASSLYKTQRPVEARQRVEAALALTRDAGLQRFLAGLARRIDRRLAAT